MNEIVPAQPRVVFQENPFSSQFRTFSVEGRTVGAMVQSLKIPEPVIPCLRVWVDDEEIAPEHWELCVPKAGQHVYVRVIPQGGDDSGKTILRTIAMVAIAVVAVATGQYWAMELGFTTVNAAGATVLSFGGQMVAAGIATGISLVGNLALNALIPPPGLKNNSQDSDQRFRLTGVQNSFAPFGNIPRVFGKVRLYPVLAGRPYSEIQGNDEYLRIALCAGWGPLQITDIKIGETPITSFEGVEYEIREGWAGDAPLTLYSRTVTEDKFSVLLSPGTGTTTTTVVQHPESGSPGSESYTPAWEETVTTNTPTLPAWSTRTSAANAAEISVDLSFPAGLSTAGKTDRNPRTVEFAAQYSANGTTWTDITWANNTDEGFGTAGKITVTSSSYSAVRVSGRFKPPSTGQYQVRIRRLTGAGDDKTVDTGYWTALRTIKTDYPVNQSGLCLIALRIKATSQLNGVPQTINCIAESYLPTPIDNGGWQYTLSSNPAWAVVDLLRRRGGQTFLADARIDIAAFTAWAAECAATAPNASEPRWSFNGVVEGGSIYEAIRLICGNARAFYMMKDGKHSVVRDVAQTTPAQHITPRNSWGYSGSKRFINYPHALRVLFVNKDEGYQQDERIVYDDGYTSANATKFETLELTGASSATQAFREARYHMAVARLRPEEHTVTMDIESLRCNIGDLVYFAHDAISVGLMQSRCASISTVSTNTTSITLEDEVYLESGKSYAVRVRQSNGTTRLFSVNGGANVYTRVLTPSSTLATSAGPQPGDLVMFGEAGITSAPMIVKRIEPGEDLTARVSMVNYDAAVYTADTGTIPAFTSYINYTGGSNGQGAVNEVPDAPTIASAKSNASTAVVNLDGTVLYRLAVSINPPASGVVRVDYYELQYREFKNVGGWETVRVEKDSPSWIGGSVVVGFSYEIRVRAISEAGLASDWSPSWFVTASSFTSFEAVPTNLALTRVIGGVRLTWTNPNDPMFDLIEVWENTSASTSGATRIATVRGSSYDRLGILSSDAVRYFYIRAVDTTGLTSAYVGPVSSFTAISRATLDLFLTNAAYTSGYGLSNYQSAATTAIATAAAGLSPTTPVLNDRVTFYNGGDYQFTLQNNGSFATNGNASWVAPGIVMDGGLMVTGKFSAAQIDTRGLTIRDAAGNVILASGYPLTSGNIAVGYGINVVPNADFIDGIGTLALGFENMSGTPTIGINATNKRVAGESTAFLSYVGATTSGQLMGADVKNGPNTYFSVTPGSRYEFSGYLNVDRCIGYLTLAWYDANGTYISEVTSNSTTTTGDFTSLAGMTRVSGFATAPANAVRALLVVRGQSTGLASPVVYFSRLYFGLANASQTELSPWTPGRGIAQITPSNASTYIASLAVDTLQIAGNAATVPVAADQSSTVYWYGAGSGGVDEWSGDGSVLYWKNVVNNISVNFGTANTTNKAIIGFSYQANAGSGGSWFSRWRIVRDDAVIIKSGDFGIADNTGGPTVTGIVFDNDTGNGTHTYKLQVAIWGNIGATWDGTAYVARTVVNGTLFAIGAKR